MHNSSKILITGATGQIGRFLVRKMKENNLSFVGIDINNSQDASNSNILLADLTNTNSLNKQKSMLEDCDTVIHLASVVDSEKDVVKNGIKSIDINIDGTLNLLEFLPKLKYFLFASTYMIYGIPKSNPVKENHLQCPTTVYGASKLITEKFLNVYSRQKKIDLTIFRIMGVYGLENPYAVQAIPSFIKLMSEDKNPIVFGTGLERRNHIYIDDVIDCILSWIKNKKVGVFNIGCIDAPTNLELISLINDKLNKKIKPVFKQLSQKQFDFITDISKMKTELKFKPKTKIKDGINKTVERFFEEKNK